MSNYAFHRDIESLRSMIDAIAHSIRLIEENLRAAQSFEQDHPPDAAPELRSMHELKMRRNNLVSTQATLRRRLESMRRTLSH